jgi:hypothetical protein
MELSVKEAEILLEILSQPELLLPASIVEEVAEMKRKARAATAEEPA